MTHVEKLIAQLADARVTLKRLKPLDDETVVRIDGHLAECRRLAIELLHDEAEARRA